MIDLPNLYAECASIVHPVTIDAIVAHESGRDPLAINVNGVHHQPRKAATIDQAVQTAELWMARGYSVDIGLAQVNSKNLPALRQTVRSILDPCENLRNASKILAANYLGAAAKVGPGQFALAMALSAYNTGNYTAGFQNGYVAHYTGYAVPALSTPTASKEYTSHSVSARINPALQAALANLRAPLSVPWDPADSE